MADDNESTERMQAISYMNTIKKATVFNLQPRTLRGKRDYVHHECLGKGHWVATYYKISSFTIAIEEA